MAGKITVVNETNCDLLVSVFNKGDDGIPFEAGWVHRTREFNTGDFKSVGIGVQVQSGGNWVDSPTDQPFANPGQTVKITCVKTVS